MPQSMMSLPPWVRTRFGYTWSPETLGRLTPERRFILQPVAPMVAGDSRIPLDLHATPSPARPAQPVG